MGKVYIANAGDSRAVLFRGDQTIPLSSDFTPETERHRIQIQVCNQTNLET